MSAMCELGDDHHKGRNGKDKDDVKAAEAWLKGAEEGCEQCMKKISWAYENGVGVDVDFMLMEYWKPQE